MKLVIAEDVDDLSAKAFALVDAALAGVTDPVVVLPTGNTPLGLYAEAVRQGPKSKLAHSRFVQLDEYHGIAADDRRSLSGWFDRVLLSPLGIPKSRLIAFDSETRDPDAEAARVEALVAKSGIDLAILGLGPNGHLGFNEPGSDFGSKTRLVPLTLESIKSNAVYWGSEADVPRQAFTLGLATLGRANATILLVSGAHKAEILRRTIRDPISPGVPASCLRRFVHATVIADRAAVALLT
jgi:glucosamine-6-phosphate deaminase